MSKAKTPTPKTRAQVRDTAAQLAQQLGETPEVDQVADLYPLSKRATADQVAAAGLKNGMTAEDVEVALSRVMPADE